MTTRRALGSRLAALGSTAGIAAALTACGSQRSEAPAQTRPTGKLEFYDWWLPSSSPLQEAWWKFVK